MLRNIVLCVSCALILCSCATGGGINSSYSFNGMTAPSMNLSDMHYYMNDDYGQAPILSNPNFQSDQGSGPICNPNCRF